MTGHEQTEIERKYDVDDSSAVPQFGGAAQVAGVAEVVEHEPFTLTAVYYDTENHDLARQRIVLRRREGGTDAGWHLKRPAEEGRTEVHWPLDVADAADVDSVPAAVLEPVRALVRDRPLSPLARLTTERRTLELRDHAGRPLAEIADDQVSASDARGGTYRKWREWEVELLAGAPDTRKKRTRLLDLLEESLLAAGARPSTSVAKIARAVGVESLTDLVGEDVLPGLLPAPALQDPASVAVIVVGALRELTATLMRDDPRARADAPDAVHRMRTSVRRLRSVLAVYARLFDTDAVKELRIELGHLGIELGRARDAEVRRDRLAAEITGVAPHPAADAEVRLVGGARRDYAEGFAGVRDYLLSTRYYRLLDTLEAFVAWPPLTRTAERRASAEIRRDLTRAVAALARRNGAVADADNPEAALHEVRKAARRLRYAAEAVALAVPAVPALGGGAPLPGSTKKSARKTRKKAAARLSERRGRYAEIAAVAKPVVKRLGDRHDRLLYIEQLERAAQIAHEDGENTLVYGLLVGRAERPDDTVELVTAEIARAVRRLERLAGKL